ncbi:MAG: radical SAM protein [Thermosphaera sp.]
MKAFTPVRKYRAISLTGAWCALKCSHCGGRYLRGMTPVTPETIVGVVEELWSQGVRGLLVSGGFREDGTLPIEPYLKGLRVVKERFNPFISAHLGLINDKRLLSDLAAVVDLVDFELVLNDEFTRRVRGLSVPREKYVEALTAMREAGLDVAPHVYIWHPWITRDEVAESLQTLAENNINRAVLLVYIPPEPGGSVPLDEVVENIEYARSTYPGELYMGCMRPWSIKKRLDEILVEKRLVDRIANPHPGAIGKASSVERYDACCSVPDSRLGEFKIP